MQRSHGWRARVSLPCDAEISVHTGGVSRGGGAVEPGSWAARCGGAANGPGQRETAGSGRRTWRTAGWSAAGWQLARRNAARASPAAEKGGGSEGEKKRRGRFGRLNNDGVGVGLELGVAHESTDFV